MVFTGNPAKDDEEVVDYVRTPTQLKKIQERVTDTDDELQLVIVQSLWLTGFDAPPLHTLYLDKRMRGAALMQAIARVNRTWPGKPSGLVVDFQGVIREIKEALAEYSEQDQKHPMLGADLDGAVKLVRESHQHIDALLADCAWRSIQHAGGPGAYREALTEALEFLITPEPGLEPGKATRRQRFMHYAKLLQHAFSLCPTDRRVQDLLPDIRFFEAVRTSREKYAMDEREEQGLATAADVRLLIAQFNESVVATDGVVDIYDAAGLTKPDLSHLDDRVLRDLQNSKHPNLVIAALRRALIKEIKDAHPNNITRQYTFTEKMKRAMNQYTNGLLTAAEFMKFLVDLAREVSADRGRAKKLGLAEDELAFYDALAAGAGGFLLKDAEPDDIAAAVRVVAAGDALIQPSVMRRLVETFARQAEPLVGRPDTLHGLTARERDVLHLVGRGLTNAQIAESLVVSTATVKTHVNRVMSKLALSSRAQAVVVAYESGLVTVGGDRRPTAD